MKNNQKPYTNVSILLPRDVAHELRRERLETGNSAAKIVREVLIDRYKSRLKRQPAASPQ